MEGLKGRGATENPANRYERLHLVPDPDAEDGPVPTLFLRDTSRSILAENESPDIGFRFSLNPYRGCEHGCVYCYARPSHEYLGFSAGLDFETRILVKERAPDLLRRALADPGWEPQVIALSGNTDPYQPVERRLGITRRCLEVLCEFRNPVGVVTKSALVQRDADLLADLAADDAARVSVSITSLDPDLSGRLEPRGARPHLRLETVAALAAAGVPTGVLVAPVIPGLNDHEIPRILSAAAAAGARAASWILLRLPAPVDRLFEAWLDRHYPTRKDKVLALVRDTRDGRISDSRFGRRMRGQGRYAEHLATMFGAAARRHGLDRHLPPASVAAFRRPPAPGGQRSLF
jgi:DNA repair photolyase